MRTRVVTTLGVSVNRLVRSAELRRLPGEEQVYDFTDTLVWCARRCGQQHARQDIV